MSQTVYKSLDDLRAYIKQLYRIVSGLYTVILNVPGWLLNWPNSYFYRLRHSTNELC